jgi:hypothetical protein
VDTHFLWFRCDGNPLWFWAALNTFLWIMRSLLKRGQHRRTFSRAAASKMPCHYCVAKQHFGHFWRDKGDVNRHAEPVGLVAARQPKCAHALIVRDGAPNSAAEPVI